MSYYSETISHSTTGLKTRTCGFQPYRVRITVSSKDGGETTINHQSVGESDGTLTICDYWYDDASGKTTDRIVSSAPATGRIVSHWERVSGTLTEKVAVNFDSFTATAAKYNVVTADVNYKFFVQMWG